MRLIREPLGGKHEVRHIPGKKRAEWNQQAHTQVSHPQQHQKWQAQLG